MVSPENDDPKTREKDDHKPADAIEIKSELIKDLSEQNGEKSNLDPMDDLEKTDQNLSSTNPALDADLKISEVIVQGDQVILPFVSTYFLSCIQENLNNK